MSGIFVTELMCPKCRDPLKGLATDRVFACGACGKAVEIRDGKVSTLPLMFGAMEKEPLLPIVYLPFWQIMVEITLADGAGQDVLSLTPVANMDSVWVSAFYEVRPLYLGNPGFDITKRRDNPSLGLTPVENPNVFGANRDREEAARYAELYVMDLLDKAKDITGYTIGVKPTEFLFWALPFAHDSHSGTITDVAGNITYKENVVENFKGILSLLS